MCVVWNKYGDGSDDGMMMRLKANMRNIDFVFVFVFLFGGVEKL